MTYRDLQRWLKTLGEAQLNAPVLITGGADDFGATEYFPVVRLIGVANEHPMISGGYEGPVLLIKTQAEEKKEPSVWADPPGRDE